MSELKQHPTYTWLWLNEDGEIWSSLTRKIGNGCRRYDCGKPVHKLHPFQFRGMGMCRPYFVINVKFQGKNRVVKIHRLMADVFYPDADQVRFIDGDISNWKLSNLKPVSDAEGAFYQGRPNKHGYIGISYITKRRKWRAMVRIGGKNICVGTTMLESRLPELAAKREAMIQHYLETGEINKDP